MQQGRHKLNLPRLVVIALAIVSIWLIFAVFSASEFYRRVSDSWPPADGIWPEVIWFQIFSGLCWAVFTPFVIAIAERLPVHKPHVTRNLIALLAITPVLAVIRAAAGGAYLQWVTGERISWHFIKLSVDVRFGRWWFFIALIVVLTNVVLALRVSAAGERRTAAAQAEAAAVELATLRARVQPKFILGTIEEIKARIEGDPEAADRTIVELSDLLRRTLDHGRRSDVTLADELDLIDRYVAIEKIDAHFAVDEELLAARVPALLLQTVLNGSVFGASKSGRTLNITGRTRDERLTIEMQCRPPLAEPERPADETPTRLRRIFGGELTMRTARDETSTVITIDLPLQFASGEPA